MEKNLSKLSSIFFLESYEDFLEHILKQLDRKKKQQAYLFYTDFNLKTNLVYLKNKKLSSLLHLDKKYFFSENIKIKNTDVKNIFFNNQQKHLSDLYCKLLRSALNRPILPLSILPFFSESCVLCIENLEGKLENEKIKDYLVKYQACLSASLSQIKEQNRVHFFSFLWEQAFEKNMDPMSIENKNFVFIKKNQAFKKVLDKNKNYESTYYDIKTLDDDKVRLCHHKDVSKILLLREDLLQRKKMESLGGLADQLANQLNNPLAGIRALIQILQKSVNNKHTDSLKEIELATWRCRSIIENLKNFSNKNTSLEIFDLNQLVLDVIALSKVALSKSNCLLNLDKNKLNIKASRQLIQQVIFNLIINATQAIKDGDKIVLKSYKEKNKSILEIKDYGKGIKKDLQPKVFKAFFTTKKNKGTGLGLSMSLNIIKKFSGSIKLESEENKYTKFTLSFPFVDK